MRVPCVGKTQRRRPYIDLYFIERVLGKLGFQIQLNPSFLNTTLNIIFRVTYHVEFT